MCTFTITTHHSLRLRRYSDEEPKILPQKVEKLNRETSKSVCTNDGIICYKWQDSKDVPTYYKKNIGYKQIFNFVDPMIKRLPKPHY